MGPLVTVTGGALRNCKFCLPNIACFLLNNRYSSARNLNSYGFFEYNEYQEKDFIQNSYAERTACIDISSDTTQRISRRITSNYS